MTMRREPEGQLVDHQQLRPRHERPGRGQLLLLAARQRAGRLVHRLRIHGKYDDDPLDLGVDGDWSSSR